MKICEVCNSRKLKKVMDLGKHPLCDDLLRADSKKKKSIISYRNYFLFKLFYCFQ